MNRAFFIVCIIVFPGIVSEQQTNTLRTLLKVNVTSAADVFSFPSLQLGVERSLSKHYGIAGEAGVQVYNFVKRTEATWIKPTGLRANLELRRYFLRPTEQGEDRELLTGLYTGVNLNARQYRYNQEAYYRHVTDYNSSYSDTYWVRRGFTGMNVLVGYQGRLKKGKIFYDAYSGLGGGLFYLKEYEKEPAMREGYEIKRPNDASADDILGKKPTKGMAALNMTLGLRVGLKL